MMHDLWSRARINDEISRRDGLNDEAKASFDLKTKMLVPRGYLTPVVDPNAKATSAKLFDVTQVFRAAIMTDALIAGFEADRLRVVSEALDKPAVIDLGHPPSADIGGAFVYEGGGLISAMRGVKAGDPGQWRLDYSCGRETGKDPVWIAHVIYLPVGEPEPVSFLSVLRRPIIRGTFDLTARISQFSDLLV